MEIHVGCMFSGQMHIPALPAQILSTAKSKCCGWSRVLT